MAENLQKEVIAVLAGKSGAGKSTLMNNLFGEKKPMTLSSGSITDTFIGKTVSGNDIKIINKGRNEVNTRNDVSIKIIDMPGLSEDAGLKRKQLLQLHTYTNKRIDLLIYCVPVDPGSRFDTANPVTMKCLQEAFGREIWNKCVLIFTHSNTALEHLEEYQNDHQHEQYKEHIKNYADQFVKEFKKLGNSDQKVITIFDSTECTPNTVIAIPAGLDYDDPVLPGLPAEIDGTVVSWKEYIFSEMLRRCDQESTSALIQFKYGMAAWTKYSRIVESETQKMKNFAARGPNSTLGIIIKAIIAISFIAMAVGKIGKVVASHIEYNDTMAIRGGIEAQRRLQQEAQAAIQHRPELGTSGEPEDML